MVHYYDHIKNFGSPNGLCSSITESKHIAAVKRPWRRSNKHNALPQMLKINERLDKLAVARADFKARGMLDNSCLIQVIMDTARDTGDPMDEDASDSDETDSDASDEVSIFNSDHADTRGLNNAGTTAPDDANANTDIDADADAETDADADTNTDALNETDAHILDADYNRFRLPNSRSPTPPEEEDDHGPVESGPLMNEVRLAHKRGKGSPPRKICFLILFTASAREYPRSLGALGLKIGQHNLLDLTRRFLYYQLNPSSTIDPDNLPLAACPVIWDSKVSVFYSATATFRAPSNPSGPGGMYREAIRSTHYWSRGDIPGPRHDCVFIDVGNPGVGMQGLLVARVYLFFKFPYGGVEYPCALVHWYSTSSERDPTTRLWVVQPETTRGGGRHMSVIHIDSIIRGAHLLPKFPSVAQVYREINYTNVLDLYKSFYVNKYIDHHAFEIAF
jgi:hypothetical protein